MAIAARFRRARAAAPLAFVALALAGCADYRLNPPPAAMIRADAHLVTDPQEIVALVPNAAAARRLRIGAAAEGFALRETSDLPALGLTMLRFDMRAGMTGPEGIAALERIEPSATAGVNHAYIPVSTETGTGAEEAEPAGFSRARAGAGALDYAGEMMRWPAAPCAAAGPVGIIDTGIDAAAPELSGLRVTAAAFHRGAAAPTRHGAEVAAALADPRRLIQVSLFSAGVIGLNAEGRAEAGVDALLKALDWLAGQGVRLANVSLSGPYNKLLDRGVDVAARRGMLVVAAVGNDGAAAAPRYPAALGNVIAVTAVDARGAVYADAVRGPFVDAAAPGVDVAVVLDGRTRFVTGTSVAAPLASARIAADPRLYGADAAAVRAALAGSSADLGEPGPDPVYGAGLLLAEGACPAG